MYSCLQASTSMGALHHQSIQQQPLPQATNRNDVRAADTVVLSSLVSKSVAFTNKALYRLIDFCNWVSLSFPSTSGPVFMMNFKPHTSELLPAIFGWFWLNRYSYIAWLKAVRQQESAFVAHSYSLLANLSITPVPKSALYLPTHTHCLWVA